MGRMEKQSLEKFKLYLDMKDIFLEEVKTYNRKTAQLCREISVSSCVPLTKPPILSVPSFLIAQQEASTRFLSKLKFYNCGEISSNCRKISLNYFKYMNYKSLKMKGGFVYVKVTKYNIIYDTFLISQQRSFKGAFSKIKEYLKLEC